VIILVIGGTRSGKSAVAERVAAACGDGVTYLATAWVDPDDADHAARIDAHRTRRPAGWRTIECPAPGDLPVALTSTPGPVLVDSLGTWVAGHADLVVDAQPLLGALAGRAAPTVLVGEEVGGSVHPETAVGRRFVDALGTLNQQVAAVADRVLYVVAGRAIEMPPAGEPSC
jgi:adenosyl cobinamide kinase/adenosyl cobinamide phosphate guanylyltransferase